MFLIFDTETTGLPKNWKAPITDSDNWPRCIQLAWQLHDELGELVEVKNYIIRPEGFTIPFNAEKVHGISTERAQKHGVELKKVLVEFNETLKKSRYATGHNIDFDINILGAEFHRLRTDTPLMETIRVDSCTETTAEFCKLLGGRGGRYKLPKLGELHEKLFNEKIEEAHNAAADVEATARCVLELIRTGVISKNELGVDDDFLRKFRERNSKPFELIGLNIKPYEPVEEGNQELEIKNQEKEEDNTTKHQTPNSKLNETPFVHLHVHSQFSVLQSTASIQGIIQKAKEDSMPAVALTDQGNMFGVFQFVRVALKEGIKPIVGCEFYVCNDHKNKSQKDNGNLVVLLAKNKGGYHNLAKLCSISHVDGFYYVPRIDRELIRQYKEGLIALSGGIKGEITDLILNVGDTQAEESLLWWKETFKDDFYIELVRHGLEEEDRANEILLKLAEKHLVKYFAANNSFYLEKEDANAHDLLLCIRDGEKQSTPKGRGRGFRYAMPNDEFYFKSQEEIKILFDDLPEAIFTVQEIVDKVEEFKLERDVLLPEYRIPNEFQNSEDKKDGGKRGENAYLKHITYDGAKNRYSEITSEIQARIDFELEVIANTGYPGYFLIVQDFCRVAREMEVSVGPGRGSAAGSVVAYCIGITNIDPIKYDLLFERFLNPDRVSLPDIDIDFDDRGRDKVINYVIEKYGKNQVAQIITYGTMAPKMAIRDAGRVLELPLPETDKLAKMVPERPGTTFVKAFKEVPELLALRKQETLEGQTVRQAEILEGSVRNTGTHACGIIITPDDMTNYIPVATAKGSDLLVTQYDNSVVESAGMLKMDFLGLKTLTIINDTIEIIEARSGEKINPDEIPLDDKKTYELFQRGDTVGIFQFESGGMQRYLKELKPDKFDDLIAMNALYRPGPMEYIPNYVARKHGKEKITYDIEEMAEYLEGTYGITVYQEQVMQLSQKLANFTKGEADVLRKAMGKKIKKLLDELKPKFLDGCKANGHSEKIAEKIWKDWEAFASYAFNKSHSTCYAQIAFQTAYLKANYPAEFMAAVLTNNMNDIKKVTFFMEECRRIGVKVLGPDVNESWHKFAVNKDGQIRFGLGAVKGVGEGAVNSIVQERKTNENYSSIFDLVKRIDLKSANKKTFESLVLAGALDSFGDISRAQFLHETDNVTFLERILKFGNAVQEGENSSQASLFGGIEEIEIAQPEPPICEEWGRLQQLSKEKEVVGIYISGHPLDDFRLEIEHFCRNGISDFNDLEKLKGRDISFAGIVTDVNHRTTKTGKPFGSFTIEDYTDSTQLFLFSKDYVSFKNFLNIGWFLFIKAKVQPRFNDDGRLEVKISQIELLQEVREKMAESITLKFNLPELSDDFLGKLPALFNGGKGKCRLKVLVEDPEEEISISMPSRKIRVDLTNEFLQSLEREKIPYKVN
ncbi:MAG: DNA polymerase III subunit alpha [Bacteroidetes bacterium]|nr:MAG: DNA polymerase III subunit alpha [Bacteroidota bacterium]